MKKFKKIFAIVLAMAMVLGMSVTVFAQQTGTITVNGLNGSDVVVYYAKILGLNSDGNEWEFAEGVNADAVGMTIDQLTNKTVADASEIGKINTNLKDLELKNLTYQEMGKANEEGSITSDLLEPGLYAIKAVDTSNEYVYSYMVAAINYENGTIQSAVVTAKGSTSQPEKEIVKADDNSVAAGDEVEFKITVNYPSFATASIEKNMTIEDSVTNAKIIENTISIPEGYGLSAEVVGDTILRITLDADAYNSEKAGDSVVITYKVKVNKASELTSGTVSNKVSVSVPDANGDTTTRQAIVEIPTVKAEIVKVNSANDAITNNPATFALYKEVAMDTEGAKEIEVSSGGTKWLLLVDTQSTNDDGVATFKGLDANDTVKYYVKETKAPEGFTLEPKAYPLTGATVSGTGTPSEAEEIEGVMTKVTTYTATDFTNVGFGSGMNFKDTTLSSLPSTGGIGTTIFTIGGCAIIIVAAGLFFASRRKKSA